MTARDKKKTGWHPPERFARERREAARRREIREITSRAELAIAEGRILELQRKVRRLQRLLREAEKRWDARW